MLLTSAAWTRVEAQESGDDEAAEATDPAAEAADAEAVEAEADEAPAPPEDPNVVEARERIARASQLFEQENYDAALAEFHEVLELIGDHPVRFQVLYNIAKAYEALYRYDQAMEFYRRFLDGGGRDTALATEVETKVQVLEGLLGTIFVEVSVADYEVWVDDRLVGENRDRVMVPGGSHVVEVRASGFIPTRKEVQVPARAERTLTFELEELAEEFEGLPSYLFWIAAGGAAAAVVGGTIYGIRALQRRNEIDDILGGPTGGVGEVTSEDKDEVGALSRNADIFFGAALLLGTTAVIFAIFTDWGGDDDEAETAGLRLSPAVGRDSAGLWLEGSF